MKFPAGSPRSCIALTLLVVASIARADHHAPLPLESQHDNRVIRSTAMKPKSDFADSCPWTHSFASNVSQQVGFPNTHVKSWSFGWRLDQQGGPLGIKLEGQFPDARYMSVSLYDGTTGAPLLSVPDFRIIPDPGSINPFRYASPTKAAGGLYTFWIVPGSHPGDRRENTIAIPDHVLHPLLILRVADHHGEEGTVLPQIEAFDILTGAPTPCPNIQIPSRRDELRQIIESLTNLEARAQISFNRFRGLEPMPNPDQQSLSTILNFEAHGDVAIIQMRPPNLGRRGDVRMWTLCAGSAQLTSTSECILDEAVQIAPNGLAIFVFGPDQQNFRQRAAKIPGVNYVSLRQETSMVFYRQLLPHARFVGNIGQVPVVHLAVHHRFEYNAERWLNEFAPTGSYCSGSEFLESGLNCLN